MARDRTADPRPSDVGLFADLPRRIRRKGRVAGFERMRDRLMAGYEQFAGAEGRYKALKAILEVDRHAMFAEVAASRDQGQTDQKTYERFQAYLAGEIDTLAPPEPRGGAPKPKPTKPRPYGAGDDTEETPDEDSA